jgi:hypothetical protein
MVVMVLASIGGRERVGEEELGQFALTEGDDVLCLLVDRKKHSIRGTYFGAVLIIGLHLHTLTKIHQRLVDLAGFSEGSTRSLCIACTFRSSQVDDCECAARPGTLSVAVPLLDFNTEEAMATRADCVTSGASDLSLHKAGLEHHECFFKATADDLSEPSNDLPIWALLCALEQQGTALQIGMLVPRRSSRQEVEDTVIVHLIHRYDDSILCVWIRRNVDVMNAGALRKG